jgi:hypothetical protein
MGASCNPLSPLARSSWRCFFNQKDSIELVPALLGDLAEQLGRLHEVGVGSIPKTHPTLFHTIPIGICGFGGFL